MGTINAYIYFYDKREQKKMISAEKERMKQIFQDEQNKSEPLTEIKPETKSLVLSTLRRMNCQPMETEEGRIIFEYQGVKFLMEAEDDCLFVNLIWPWCHSFNIYDINEYARVRKVVNDVNSWSSCTVFLIEYRESDEVAVHLRKNFVFVSQITPLSDYLCGAISGFFKTVKELETEIEKVRIIEREE